MSRMNRTRYRRSKKGRLAGILVIVVMVLYIPAMWRWFFTKGMDTGIIREDTLVMTVSVTGVFVRQEEVLVSPENGVILPASSYGERLPSGGKIASFIRTDDHDMYRQYRNAESDLLLRVMEASLAGGEQSAVRWLKVSDKDVSGLSLASMKGDFNAAADIRDGVNRVLAEQARMLVSRTSGDGYLEEEKQELEKLKNRMDKNQSAILTPVPGIVCYAVDGYEAVWTPEVLETLSVEAIERMPDQAPVSNRWVTPLEIPVAIGQPYGKLVQNEMAWFAFKVDAKTLAILANRLQHATLGKNDVTVPMAIEGVANQIPMQLISVQAGPAEDADGLVIAKFTRQVEQTMELRKANAELILQDLQGMKVPRQSLFNHNPVDGTADLFVVKMNRAQLKRVRVQGLQDAWAIIQNLDNAGSFDRVSVYDVYLQNPDGVMDGQVIEK